MGFQSSIGRTKFFAVFLLGVVNPLCLVATISATEQKLEYFPQQKGAWVGARIGLSAQTEAGSMGTGYMDVDWIRIDRLK
jgi:hypothetical protein